MRTMGTVKWFDPLRGEGCVVSEGGAQALLSRLALAAAGLKSIATGAALTCEMKLTRAGLAVTEIYEIAGKSPRASGAREGGAPGR